ncbi:conserved hypothetical protein [Desulforapulum autotrophicum HRM2]|uniref:Polyhydroxyalkanoate synthesis regulator phasin n=1 Tax=Desulforapulum autotrophicum (strain ATCC 43914 / DSM 3382 / VKM B-1955 / HRM2) TaxID=177437 RepID=C0QKV5_DESAH|nr:hypothetical protein [Desulforapulum autotrophicum]ACN16195.1 conserved hypothetical protein [Desulforapulum autotrophicum HRM2]
MLDYMKKSFLAGVGLALRSKKEIEDLAREFAEKGKMDQQEGQKFLDDIMDRYDETVEKFDHRVESAVEKILKKTDLARRSDLVKLKKEITEIKAMLVELQAGSVDKDET